MQFWSVSPQNGLKMCEFLRCITCTTCRNWSKLVRLCCLKSMQPQLPVCLVWFLVFFWLHGLDLQTLEKTGFLRFFCYYDIKKTETRPAWTLLRPRLQSSLNRSWSSSVPSFFQSLRLDLEALAIMGSTYHAMPYI